MDGKVFIYINDLINNLANNLGIKVNASDVATIINNITNQYSSIDILNGKADADIKNHIANKYNITISSPKEVKNNTDIFRSIKIANAHQEEGKEVERYIRNYVQNMGLSEEDTLWIIKETRNTYKNIEIFEDKHIEYINKLLEFINLKNNSTTKEENKIVSNVKKPKDKRGIIKKILTFVVVGSISITVISSYKNQKEENEFVREVEDSIEMIINNDDDEVKSNIVYAINSEEPNIITKNASPTYGNDGQIYTIYDIDGIVEDIKDIVDRKPELLDLMIIYTFSHMQVDTDTKINAMNQILEKFGIPGDFISYMSSKVDNKEELKKENLDKLANEFLNTKRGVYVEYSDNIQELGDNINGTSRH